MAQILGVALTSLDSFVKEGCPVIKKAGKGVASEYDAPSVVQWYVQRMTEKAASRADAGDLDRLKARKLEIENETKTIALLREKGEILPLRQFEQTLATVLASIRAPMLSLPQRATMRLAGETETSRIALVLREEVEAALNAGADAYVAAVEEQYPEGVTDEA